MGLTGAGKSTFISVITGNKNIPIGAAGELDGGMIRDTHILFNLLLVPKIDIFFLPVTEEVQDYLLWYTHNNTHYEIHLIDSPGFDDGNLVDTQVLSEIATYVNTTYKLKKRLAGVLYLHDITKAKLGGVGQRNLRMLEKMIGQEEYSNCTLVTTKWGCTTNSQDEEQREATLKEKKKFFGGMLGNGTNERHARMERFHPKTRERALQIITPYLHNKFTPKISQQMVDPHGPKLRLGETEAGKVIADHLEEFKQNSLELGKVKQAQEILSQKYDETLFSDFNQQRRELRRKYLLQRSGRWIMRITLMGGAITASILTAGPGASAFALTPVLESALSVQKKAEEKEKAELEGQFVKKSQNANKLKEIKPDWLWDMNVQQLQDVELYSLKSKISAIDMAKVVQRGEFVGSIAADGSETVLDLDSVGWAKSYSDSDADFSELDDNDNEKE